jgi:hypothetical protein
MAEPLLGIDDLKIGYMRQYVLASAMTTTDTTCVLTSGGGDFAGATSSTPIELTVITGGVGEKMLVTARSGNTLTVTRGQMGTTAATHAANDVAKAIFEVDVGMAQNLSLDPQIDTIEYNGDGTRVQVPISRGVSGTINVEFWTKELLELAAGVTRYTANLPPDEVARAYPELGTYPFVRIRGRVRVIETSAGGAAGHWRLEVPKAILQRPLVWGDVASGEATKFEFNFTAFKTRTDISDAVLPNLGPSEEVDFVIAELVA